MEAETLAQYLREIQSNVGIKAEVVVTYSHLFKTPLSVWTRLMSGASPAVLLNRISLFDPTHGANTGATFVLSHFTFGVSDIAKSRKASAKALSKMRLAYGGAVPLPK